MNQFPVNRVDDEGCVDCADTDAIAGCESVYDLWARLGGGWQPISWKQAADVDAPTAEERGLPLHVKAVEGIDITFVDTLARRHGVTRRWIHLKRFLFDPKIYEQLECRRPTASVADAADMVAMRAASLVADLSGDMQPKGFVRFFTVVEGAKHRRRPIEHTADINSHFRFVPSVRLPSVEQVCQVAGTYECGAIFDFAGWYFQFKLGEAVRPWFCVGASEPTDARVAALTCLPMGMRHSCALAHFVTILLVRETIRRVDGRVKAQAYIDNVRFVGSVADVSDACFHFREVSREANAIINDDASGVACRYDFLGVSVDHLQRTVCLTEKRTSKINTVGRDFTNYPLKRFFQLMGRLFSASVVLGIPLAQFYFVIKCFRRRCALFSKHQCEGCHAQKLLTEPAGIWPSVHRHVARWLDLVLDNRPRIVVPNAAQVDWVVFTDASDWGAGVMMFEAEGRCMTHSRQWEPQMRGRPIVEREAEALLEGMRLLPAGATARVFVDNTSVLGAVNKGRSPSYRLNKLVELIAKAVVGLRSATFEYVKSANNAADGLSRGEPFSDETAVSACGAELGGW